MEAVGQRLYAWQLGLNEPFKDFGYRVEVKDNSWDWIDSEKKLIPPLSVPSAVAISNSSIFRLNKDGNLDVFRDGQKSHSSSEVFGGHPVSIKARRSQTTTDRHPSMLSWKTSTGQTRLVVGNNQTKGIPYFKGLQSYDESRLYLLLNQSDYLDTLWESERLSGYIAGVFPGPGGPWVISVLPSNEETVIKKLKNVDYHFDK